MYTIRFVRSCAKISLVRLHILLNYIHLFIDFFRHNDILKQKFNHFGALRIPCIVSSCVHSPSETKAMNVRVFCKFNTRHTDFAFYHKVDHCLLETLCWASEGCCEQTEPSCIAEGVMPRPRDETDVTAAELCVMKRKRNSYADSPHKLRCPYCPRAFPWISSLKRHILTHTGNCCVVIVRLHHYA